MEFPPGDFIGVSLRELTMNVSRVGRESVLSSQWGQNPSWVGARPPAQLSPSPGAPS